MNKNTVKAFIVAIAMVCTSNLTSFAGTTNDEATASVKTKISQVSKSLSFNIWVEYISPKDAKFAKTLDFSNLNDGKYTIEVLSSNVDVIDSKTFEIKTNQTVNRDIVVAIR